MAPKHLSVVDVAPHHAQSRHTSAAASSATPVSPQPPLDVKHGQDTLLIVKDPKLPVTEPDTTPSTSSPQYPIAARTTRRHVAASVSPVHLRIDEASVKQGVKEMTTSACSFLDSWPLSGFFKLVGRGRNAQTDPPAPQLKEAEANAKEVVGATGEEDMMPPPPYSPSK